MTRKKYQPIDQRFSTAWWTRPPWESSTFFWGKHEKKYT